MYWLPEEILQNWESCKRKSRSHTIYTPDRVHKPQDMVLRRFQLHRLDPRKMASMASDFSPCFGDRSLVGRHEGCPSHERHDHNKNTCYFQHSALEFSNESPCRDYRSQTKGN